VGQDSTQPAGGIRHVTQVARNDVDMGVIDGLTRREAVVDAYREPVGPMDRPELLPDHGDQIPELLPLVIREVEDAPDVATREDKSMSVRRRLHVRRGDRQPVADPDPIGRCSAERAVELHGELLKRGRAQGTAWRESGHAAAAVHCWTQATLNGRDV